MKVARRLLAALEHPVVPLFAHGLLALGALFEMIETPLEAMFGVEMGVHHGVFAFAALNLLQQLAHFLLDSRDTRGALAARSSARSGAGAPPEAE